MSLLMITVIVVGYLAVVGFALTLLAAAKRADAQMEREHEELVRSITADLPRRLAREDDRVREGTVRRQAG